MRAGEVIEGLRLPGGLKKKRQSACATVRMGSAIERNRDERTSIIGKGKRKAQRVNEER